MKTVEPVRALVHAREAVFRKSWSTAGAHTLAIEVVGTPGHPIVAIDELRVIAVSRRAARSADRDHLDLDAVVRGQGGHADRRPGRRLGREVLAVDRVHRREVAEVAQVDRALDDVRVVEADRVEQPPDVVEHRARLGLDAARDGAVAAGRVADLAGDEDEAVGLDDLAETG